MKKIMHKRWAFFSLKICITECVNLVPETKATSRWKQVTCADCLKRKGVK